MPRSIKLVYWTAMKNHRVAIRYTLNNSRTPCCPFISGDFGLLGVSHWGTEETTTMLSFEARILVNRVFMESTVRLKTVLSPASGISSHDKNSYFWPTLFGYNSIYLTGKDCSNFVSGSVVQRLECQALHSVVQRYGFILSILLHTVQTEQYLLKNLYHKRTNIKPMWCWEAG